EALARPVATEFERFRPASVRNRACARRGFKSYRSGPAESGRSASLDPVMVAQAAQRCARACTPSPRVRAQLNVETKLKRATAGLLEARPAARPRNSAR